MSRVQKRVIIHNSEEGYHAIHMREKRSGTLQYFNKVNKGEVMARDIDELKIFHGGDLYYLAQLRRKDLQSKVKTI